MEGSSRGGLRNRELMLRATQTFSRVQLPPKGEPAAAGTAAAQHLDGTLREDQEAGSTMLCFLNARNWRALTRPS